jgi:serine/threonine protein kinase
MSARKKPSLTPLSVTHEGTLNNSFSLSDTGSFAKEGFSVNQGGLSHRGGEVSNLQLEHVEQGALIGRGASSRVYCAVHRPTGIRLALKVLQEDIERSREARHMVMNEIKVVYNACSDHLVQFHDAFFYEGNICLALECAAAPLHSFHPP